MRPQGFGRTADVAVDLLVDDRLLDAVELVGPRALTGYLAVVTTSWARGERVTLQTAARRLPAVWALGDVDELDEALQRVGLLDADSRIPELTWASWYGPAEARLAQAREAGSRGGKRAQDKLRSTDAASDARASARATARATAQPYLPTDLPTDRPTDAAPSGASVGLSPSAPRDPDGPGRRSSPTNGRPSGPTKAEDPDTRTFREKLAAAGYPGPDGGRYPGPDG